MPEPEVPFSAYATAREKAAFLAGSMASPELSTPERHFNLHLVPNEEVEFLGRVGTQDIAVPEGYGWGLSPEEALQLPADIRQAEYPKHLTAA